MAQRGGFRGGRRGRDRPAPYSWRERSPRGPPWQPNKEGEGLPQPEFGVQAGVEDSQNSRAVGDGRREKKFSNKARLFIGNLPRDYSEEEVKKLFEKFGEVQEVYINKEKNFGFVRMGYRSEAERAIAMINGSDVKGRDIKVRFAASSCSVKVTNLHPVVSNELLAEAFSHFGEVEAAVVVTDERGKSLGYGIVDFARKAQAIAAIQRCKNEHFLLTRAPMPVMVRELVRDNDDEGQPERMLPKNAAYQFERDLPPRFAQPGTLEFEAASRWRAFVESGNNQREEVEERIRAGKVQLEHDLTQLEEQRQTIMLRQEIARHQQEQMRLGERLRQQEERLHMFKGGVSQPIMGPPQPLGQPPPLFGPGSGQGGDEGNQQQPRDPGSLLPGGVIVPLMGQKFR